MNDPTTSLPNPFPGLRPFRSDEHHLFFGREDQTNALLQLLCKNRFLAVVGTSGSGKSSLVRAGLIAELHSGTMTQAGSHWEVMILRPGGSPVDNVARALVDADLHDPEDPGTLPRLRATLSRSRFGLVEAIKHSDVMEPHTNLLIVVDQFEELFRFRQQDVDSEEAATAFVNLLLTASEQEECPIYVAITMRSDYLGDCSEIPGLAEAVNEGEYLIPRLMRDQKRDAIEKPVGVGGAKISPLLVQRLLNDVGDDPDQLPVLQHALMRMWEVWSASGDASRPIDFCDFEATGGLAAALSNHADEIFESLPDEPHRLACEKIFKTLTEKGDDNRGIRRPTRLEKLIEISGADRETVSDVLDAFRQPGVTFLMPSLELDITDRSVIDLSHESLMRGWQRLRTWVEDEAQSARIFRRLLDTSRLWSEGRAGLFRDPDLQIALSWRDQERPNEQWAEQYGGSFETADSFLEMSGQEAAAEENAREAARQRELEQSRALAEAQRVQLEHQRRSARKLRKMISGLAVVAAIAGVACIVALIQYNKAKSLTEVAERAAVDAQESAVEAEIQRDQAKSAQLETKNALEIVESQKAQVEGSLIRAEVAKNEAKIAEGVAREAEERGRHLLYATDMQLAVQYWEDEQVGTKQLRDQLAAHRPDDGKEDLRGFEWYYSKYLIDNSANVFSGHDASVVDAALLEGSTLVTLDERAHLKHWDLETNREIGESFDLSRGRSQGGHLALSRDGRMAAVALKETTKVVDTATGEDLLELDAALARIGLLFSPDSRMLITVDVQIKWWDTQTGQLIASGNTVPTRGNPGGLSISADGFTVAAAGIRGPYGDHVTLFHLDLAKKEVIATNKEFSGTLGPIALSPDSTLFATCNFNAGPIAVYTTDGFQHVVTNSSAHISALSSLTFSDDGKFLISADQNGMIKTWDDPLTLKSPQTTLKGHEGIVSKAVFRDDGKQVLSCGADKTVRLWDLPQPGAIRSLDLASGYFPSQKVCFSPDGLLIAAADANGVQLWDAGTAKKLKLMAGKDDGYPIGMAFSPDNRMLAAGFGGKTDVSHIVLWDIDLNERLAVLPGTTSLPEFKTDDRSGLINQLAFSPDGRFLVAGFGSPHLYTDSGYPTPVIVWEVATRQQIRRLAGHNSLGTSLTFSNDGSKLATCNYDGTARIWDTQSWKSLHVLHSTGGYPLDVSFSPDGRTLALGDVEGHIQLWDVETGKLRETLEGHSNSVSAVAFAPNGRTLASASVDQTVRMWNVATSRELLQLDPGSVDLSNNQTLAFSKDGRKLIAGGRSVAFWTTETSLWSDARQTAENLQWVMDSKADFKARIRLLSGNIGIRDGLTLLLKEHPNDIQLQAAVAAADSHWYAWREQWPESVEAYNRFADLSPEGLDAWLRTPGLLRVATALLQENRPTAAASLLIGGAGLRTDDGLAIVKKDELLTDPNTGRQLQTLLETINARLDETPQDPGLLELRAELAGQWSGFDEQVADYTAAINSLSGSSQEEAKVDDELASTIARLYTRRGDANYALENWRQAHEDYAHGVTDENQDESLLARQGSALGNFLISDLKSAENRFWTPLKPRDLISKGGATLTQLEDGSILASGPNPAVDTYTLDTLLEPGQIVALRLETIPDPSMPHGASGRSSGGNFRLAEFEASLLSSNDASPIKLTIEESWSNPEAGDATAIKKVWDGEPSTFWNNWAGRDKHHELFFKITTQELAKPTDLRIRLIFAAGNLSGLNLGRFRISVANRASALEFAKARYAEPTDENEKTDSLAKLAEAYRLDIDRPAIDQIVARSPEVAIAVGDTLVANSDWTEALAQYDKAIHSDTTNRQWFSKRAKVYEQLEQWEQAAGDWARAADDNPDGPEILVEFSERLLAAGQIELANVQRQTARAAYELSLEKYSGNSIVADALARLLLSEQIDWTTLEPSELKAESGATLTRKDDGSILAGGARSTSESYSFIVDEIPMPITALRLETLPDPSLPNGASGRSPVGNFHLIEFKAYLMDDAGNRERVEIANATSSSPNMTRFIEQAFDDSPETWWAVYPEQNQPHHAIFVLKDEITLSPDKRLIIELDSGSGNYQVLGCFRISHTAANPGNTNALAHLDDAGITDPWARLAVAYQQNGESSDALELFQKALFNVEEDSDREKIVEEIRRHAGLLAALLELHPEDPDLRLGEARELAEKGREMLDQGDAEKALVHLQRAWYTFNQVFTDVSWTPLEPTESKSEGGATLTLQEDSSILASGENPEQDTYRITAPAKLDHITAIRLEVLPDPSLPKNGPGRYEADGNFHLNEFQVSVADSLQPLTEIAVSFAENDQYARIIDGTIDSTYWGTDTKPGTRQEAIFASDLQVPSDTDLIFRLTFSESGFQHGLGKFRLSVTGDQDAFSLARRNLHKPIDEQAALASAIGKAHALLDQAPEAVNMFETALQSDSKLESKMKVLADLQPFDKVMRDVAISVPDDAQLQLALADHYSDQGNGELKSASLDHAKKLLEEQLVSSPGDAELATQLADVVLTRERDWHILTPIEMTSDGGASLSKLDDNSILASGTNSLGDAYSIIAETSSNQVAAIRLEALIHESLPKQGPGRDGKRDQGNFDMIGFEVGVSTNDEKLSRLELIRVAADYSAHPLTIDRWNAGSRGGQPHTAVYLLKEPVDLQDAARMHVRMQFSRNEAWPGQNLGRFRLSVARDRQVFDEEVKRFAVMNQTDPWIKLATAYQIAGDMEFVAQLVESHPEIATQIADAYAEAKDWKRSIAFYDKVITDKTTDSDLLIKRATAYEQIEDWDAAAADLSRAMLDLLDKPGKHQGAFDSFKKAKRWNEAVTFGWSVVEKTPTDRYSWLRLAPVLVLSGDEEAYQTFCRRMTRQFKENTDPWFADVLCKSCLLQPGGIEISQLPGDLIAKVLDDGTVPSGLAPWAWTCRALLAYRSGDPAFAVDYAKKSRDLNPAQVALALNLSIDALAQHALERPDEAASLIKQATALIETLGENETTRNSHDFLIAQILLREAVATINGMEDGGLSSSTDVARKSSKGSVWKQAIVEYSKSINSETTDPELLSKRAEAYEQIRDWKAAAEDWMRAARDNPAGGWLLTNFAERMRTNDETDLAAEVSAEAKLLFDKALQSDPDNYLVADAITQQIVSQLDNDSWTTLAPTEMTASGGATLTMQLDGSLLASGPNPDRSIYTVTATSPVTTVTAIRLETIPDASLPNQCSGRSDNGNYTLAEISISVTGRQTSAERPVSFSNAWADFDDATGHVATVIDGQADTFWSSWGGTSGVANTRHWAQFKLSTPIELADGEQLRITLDSGVTHMNHGVGRFRLSVTDGLTRVIPSTVTNPWARLAAAYLITENETAFQSIVDQHPDATTSLGDLYAAEGNWKQAIDSFTDSITSNSTDPALFLKRASAYESIEDWDAAFADWTKAVELQPTQLQNALDTFKRAARWSDAAKFGWMVIDKEPEVIDRWISLAALVSLANDEVTARVFRQRLLDQFGKTNDPRVARISIKAYLITSREVDWDELPLQPFLQSISESDATILNSPWTWGIRALMAYRQGDPQATIEFIDEAKTRNDTRFSLALNLALRSLAQCQLGNFDQAREALEAGSEVIDEFSSDEQLRIHHDLLIAKSFLSKAESALNTDSDKEPSTADQGEHDDTADKEEKEKEKKEAIDPTPTTPQ